jgi:redox-sensitive bicupin YhaK (pirin superfamily)
MRAMLCIYNSPKLHWIGDGFPVRSLFSQASHGQHSSPFVQADYLGPTPFVASPNQRQVGEHSHQGIETVTIVYQGELEHRDTLGHTGVIGPGDVLWMTAGSGITHDVVHSESFSRQGGILELVHLWVQLPPANKTAAPSYQLVQSKAFPVLDLPDDAGRLRVMAGEYRGRRGPIRTFTPMNVWDLHLRAGNHTSLSLKRGDTGLVLVLHGTIRVNGQQLATVGDTVLLDRQGDELTIYAASNATMLLLSGEPVKAE